MAMLRVAAVLTLGGLGTMIFALRRRDRAA